MSVRDFLVAYLEGMSALFAVFALAWLVEKLSGRCVADHVARWLGRDERAWRRDERRCAALIARECPSEAQEMALYRAEAAKWGEFAHTLDEIRGLREVQPWERWLP